MKLKENIATSENGFVFDSTTGESFSVNELGVEIFNMLKKNLQFEEIKYNIMEKYEVDEITFEKSFLDFTSMLTEFNLIEND